MKPIIEQLKNYIPFNEQESRDKELILAELESNGNVFTRESTKAHITVSAWVVNNKRNKVLMAYHNIYNSWAWLGGHADGDEDLLGVALKEAREESGIKNVHAISKDIFSIEVLTVNGHIKKGEYVSSHLHLNFTYLLEADENEALAIKADENSNVGWLTMNEAVEKSTEAWIKENIYTKLIEKMEFTDE